MQCRVLFGDRVVQCLDARCFWRDCYVVGRLCVVGNESELGRGLSAR